MMYVNIYAPDTVDDHTIRYVVIAARFKGQWLFAKHKNRLTWDMPGGHREQGEIIEDAARRELWEETGAVNACLQQVCVYSVFQNGTTDYGMLFYADVDELDDIPYDSEMEKRQTFDCLPLNHTYPDIYPTLFSQVQGWLNRSKCADELWDIYDENRCLTGRIHRRGDWMKTGEYHLVVHVWIVTDKGKFLLTKRSADRGFANMWESTGGSAHAGEDSITAALREVREETGIVLNEQCGELLFSVRKENYFRDVWIFSQNISLDSVHLQPGETVDKRLASKEEIRELLMQQKLVPYDYLEELFVKADRLA